jgi:tetratricopeptide (TPR) repeat protein
VVVRQHILPGPGREIPLYQSFLEQINYETLVTYNGKAFDWPQLKTRHTLIKEHVPKLPEFGHFDLYHASRRLWKQKLEKVKLSAVEEEILGFKRENDIPGYLAPMIYFDYVERNNPDILFGVIKHNELDVLSLITLYIHLSRQIMQADGYGAESLEIARWMSYLGKKEAAYTTYQTVLKEGSSFEKVTAKHAIAYQKKKSKKYEEALQLWKEVSEIGEGKQQLEATIECAKLLEHQFKAYEAAIEFVEKAFNCDAVLVAPLIPNFDKRLLRLQKKQQKNPQKQAKRD